MLKIEKLKLFFLLLFILIPCHSKLAEIFIKTLQSNTQKLIHKNLLFKYKKKHFINTDEVHINVIKDEKLITKILQLNGFFNVHVKYNISEQKNSFHVEFNINEGRQYKISNIYLHKENSSKSFYKNTYSGKYFNVNYVALIENDIIKHITTKGYTTPTVDNVNIEINHSQQTVNIDFYITKGEKQFFGNTVINGANNISIDFVEKFIPWKKGEIFSNKKLEQFKEALFQLGLFTNIDINLSQNNNYNDVCIILVEDKKYQVELGVKFSTTNNITYKNNDIQKLKGLIGKISWANNNFGKNCDKLLFTTEGMPIYDKTKIINATKRHISPDYKFNLNLLKTELFFCKYNINYFSELKQKWFNKYVKKGFIFGGNLAQNKREELNTNYKIFIEHYKLKTFESPLTQENFFTFLNFEYTLDIDKRERDLNPQKGFRAIYKIIPELCLNKSSHILMIDSFHSLYIKTGEKQILVPWVKFASIFTKSNYNLPVDKLLYSGGPKSIRGYYLNFAGEVINDIPVGGKSVIELGVEIRHKFNSNWGGALFVEGSKITKSSIPSLGKFYNSYGFGVEYYTSIGPIKINLGFPFKKRKGIDSFMQISILCNVE